MRAPTLKRGELWTVKLPGGRGSVQRGVRPALVIQNDVGNEYSSTTIVAAVTSTIKIYPMTVVLEKGEGALTRRSMVNLSQIFTVDKEALNHRIGTLSAERMEAVNRAIRVSLDV